MSVKYHVYGNGGGGGPVDYATPLATVDGASWSTPALAPGSDWRFGVRAFDDATDLEESNVDAAVSVRLDAAGADATDRPLPPRLVTATAAAGGPVRVDWCYPIAAARLPWRPTGFRVYAGTPTPNYAAPAAVVPYTPAPTFRAVLTGLAVGLPHEVVARAYNAAGEETNGDAALVTPAADGPAPVDELLAAATAARGD